MRYRKKHLSRWYARAVFGIFLIMLIGNGDSVANAEGVILIANSIIPVKQLSKKEVRDLYLGKTKMWDNGWNVQIAWLAEPDISRRFLSEFVHKSPRQFNNYWKDMVFTGKTHMIPKYFDNEASLIQYVSETQGAIGYVSAFTSFKNVKVIIVK